jgi:hypothetical protein
MYVDWSYVIIFVMLLGPAFRKLVLHRHWAGVGL